MIDTTGKHPPSFSQAHAEAFIQRLDALGVKARQQTTDDGSLFIILSDGGGHGTGATFDAALLDWISCLLKKA